MRERPTPPRFTAVPQPGEWERWHSDWPEQYGPDSAVPEVWVTDNPVVATLLGPDGEPITQWRERPPIGFAIPE